MNVRTQRTLTIEEMLLAGKSISSIARSLGVSRAWVQQVRDRARGAGCKMQDASGVKVTNSANQEMVR